MGSFDARRVVTVEFPVDLNSTLHRTINQSPIKVLEVCPILIVLAATGNGLSIGKL